MYKDFKYIQNVAEDGSQATMLLNKRIGNTYDEKGNVTSIGIQGTQFAHEMLYLKACMNVAKIDVHINSVGGDVLDGYNIVDAIITHKANTHTIFAASMAGLCAIAGEQRTVADYGTLMCHPASGGKESDVKLLNIIQDSLKTLYAGRTKMNGDTIDNIFSKETWYSNSKKADFNLTDAVKAGVFDSIVSSKKDFKAINSLKKDVSVYAQFYNSLTENKTDMIKVTAVLGLKNEAAEEVIVSAIETLKVENTTKATELTAANAKVVELQTKLEGIENAAKADKKAKATSAVEAAINAGKIKNEQKDDMIGLAETNLSAFNALVATAPNLKEAVKIPTGNGSEIVNDADRAKWTAVDWSKNDPEGLRNELAKNPDFYNTLPKVKTSKK